MCLLATSSFIIIFLSLKQFAMCLCSIHSLGAAVCPLGFLIASEQGIN